ncbi:cryptochrome-1 isoform X2, partial [Paramuricea clavata]
METDVPDLERNHLHWFRKDLRLHDNPALLKCLENCENFYGVYILDTEAWLHLKTNSSSTIWRFILQCLNELNDKLRNFNSRLFVVQGSPLRVLPTLFEKWKVSRLTFNTACDLYSKGREDVVFSLASIANVEVITQTSHTLFEIERYIEGNGGNVPINLEEFQHVFSSLGQPLPPVECVEARHFANCATPNSDWLEANFGIPTLEDLEFVDMSNISTTSLMNGGEDEGLGHFKNFVEEITRYDEGKKSQSPRESSRLSPYFKFGCLSVRYVCHEVQRYISKRDVISGFLKGLETRDFFIMLASRIRNWDRINGNPVCLDIPWEENSEYLKQFRQGKTGFPWIDANIAKLKQEDKVLEANAVTKVQ